MEEVMTMRPSPLFLSQGTHAYGKETLRGIFKRLLRGLPRAGAVS